MSILRPRFQTPQDIICGFLRTCTPRCAVCNEPATKCGTLAAILADPTYFCDKHTFVDVPRYENVKANYDEGKNSELIRAAQKWLHDNRIEEKT